MKNLLSIYWLFGVELFFFENMDVWKLKIFKSTYFGFAYTNYVTEQWFDNFKIRKFFEVYS